MHPQALKIRDVGVKCATITAEKVVLEKYYLKRMWMSPNTAIRNALGGAVFPELIVCRNIPPRVKQWCRPIIIARHAFRDQYNGKDFVVPRPGTLQIKYSPTIGARYNLENMKQARVQLMKGMKEESERHRRQQTERTRKIRALRIREQQSAHRARMERQNALCMNVLQRRVEEALAAKNHYEVAQRRRLESRANGNGFDSMPSPI
ncbi:hypothetical protein HPB49_003760 [Dermacentor silvarum]|uniref:Uncharacterized protein n=1 Tax=Dermacentor silvarum TaxID=543639 RepID=A0ACB8DTN0_DERSI|nr:hypothetical protein HPB49_003760 [Dermacentor silvarum]